MKGRSNKSDADTDAEPGCAEKLKVLADATRLAVIQRLMHGACHVGTLGEDLGVEQSLLSHHLRLMRDAGLVTARRDGKAVLYSLAPGIGVRSPGRTINLSCCQLKFEESVPKGKATK